MYIILHSCVYRHLQQHTDTFSNESLQFGWWYNQKVSFTLAWKFTFHNQKFTFKNRTFTGSILEVYTKCTGSVLEVYWKYTGSVLEVYWKCTGSVLEVYWKYTGSVLDVYWKCIGCLLEVYWMFAIKNQKSTRREPEVCFQRTGRLLTLVLYVPQFPKCSRNFT